ncbi:acyltransferase [Luedemannella flava]|uniref:Acyltransferase n=1 Tax=Luedemannella flava TaxID=349316 RepID=A0ABN2LQS2_9ACTN
MRNRYFDVVRAVAIVRVVLYHSTGIVGLTVVLPAMGVMFALAGSLMAASLDRHGVRAVGRRLRRLLPPLWLAGAIFVPAMLLIGGLPVGWHLLRWVLPLQDPVANGWGTRVLGVVWYLREYLWFVLLSPIALWAFRRWPVPVLAVPLVTRVALEFGPPVNKVILDFGLYFGCWLLGFAHHDNLLARIRPWARVAIAVALALGAVVAGLHNPTGWSWDLNGMPLADAFWSMAFVLVLVGFAPRDLAFVDRLPRLRRAVAVLNARAVTIYLWHSSAIVAAGALLAAAGIGGLTWRLALAALLVVVAVLVFGWVEDVAARRPVRLVPGAPRPVPALRRPALPVPAVRAPVLAAAAIGVPSSGVPVSPAVGQVTLPTPRWGAAQWSDARDAHEALPRRRDRAARAEAR